MEEREVRIGEEKKRGRGRPRKEEVNKVEGEEGVYLSRERISTEKFNKKEGEEEEGRVSREEMYEAYIENKRARRYEIGIEILKNLYKGEGIIGGKGSKEEREDIYREIERYREDIGNEIEIGIGRGIEEEERDNLMMLMKESYRISGEEKFKDYMTYIEWGRENGSKFWMPRSKQLEVVGDALQELADNELDELFLAMPPRVGKSTIVMFFVSWVMMKDSEKSNLYSSYTDSVVRAFYNGLLEILKDTRTYDWKGIFPGKRIVSTNANDLIIDIERKKRYASFTGRSLYGTLNGACDCNGYEIADDLHSGIEEAMNKDRLNSAWMKVDNNLLPRAKEGAKHLWIGTRWSTIDCQARRKEMLERDDKFKNIRWKDITVPALDERDESNFAYMYNVGFSSEYYKQRRASFERNNDIASWSAQYQGVPIERNGAVFAPEDMRYYNGVLPEGDADRIYMAVDPAWGGGDYVAGPIVHQYGNDLYVADVVYSNGDKKETQPIIVKKAIENGVQAIRVEATKMTKEYAEGIDKSLKEKGYRLNVETSTKNYTGNGKEQRIFDKSPDIKDRMIFLESGKRSKEYEMFMQNVYSFSITGKNKNDDAPDSLAMAINMAFFMDNRAVVTKRLF